MMEKTRNYKNGIIITFLIMILFCLPFIITEPITAQASTSFIDINNHWAQSAIIRWEAAGVLQDFTGERFRPDSLITRAEFFAILVRALGATQMSDISRFSDVTSDSWYYNTVALACKMGIANGFTDGLMHPNDNLLRQDAATLVARALGMSSDSDWSLASFIDFGSVSPYAATYIAAFVEEGHMSGYPDGTLRPRANLSRAEAVKILDNLFPNIHQPEPTFHNVFLQGGLLVPKADAELSDMVLHGDVVIGDGVGYGNVLLSNCVIEGRLIVRGGGPNSVTLSNTSVRSIYVASFGMDNTHIAIADNSLVPEVKAISGFTLSGTGVKALTILDQAQEGIVVNLNGVSLDELNIGGRAAMVELVSGRLLNTRFDGAGQNAQLNLAADTSAENITIAAPNVTITGTGLINNLLISNSGASIAQSPGFVTVGVNLSAVVNGQVVSGPQAATSNMVDRINNSELRVQLLNNETSDAPFDQASLRASLSASRSATEVLVTQDVARRIPLTMQDDRYAYWIGFFVPSPHANHTTASLTYIYADGEPITFNREVNARHDGKRGLYIYLPVFREPGTETGQLKETLFINWDDGITENIQFMSTPLSLLPLSETQRNDLQKDFDEGIFHSINSERSPYYGSDAIRRILNSDNPLGLPSKGNKGLDALNRALTADMVQELLEDQQTAADLTVDTSGNSVYDRLSEDGKYSVAAAVLAGRRSSYTSESAVKNIFDRAVNMRMAAETSLLTAINNAVDAAALQKIIETAGNAAILNFQTAADPYKSYPPSQRLEMAKYLSDLRPFLNIQAVIDAIRWYLNNNPIKPTDPNEIVIKSITASPNSAPKPFATGNKFFAKIVVTTTAGPMSPADIAGLTLNWTWKTNAANPIASVTREGDTFVITALRVGSDTLTVTAPASNKSFNISVAVTAPILATAISFVPNSIKMIVGDTQNLRNTNLRLIPSGATDSMKWSCDNSNIATVDQLGNVIAIGNGVCRITAETENHYTAECMVMVFRDATDIVVDPDSVILSPGSSQKITAFTYVTGKKLEWDARNMKATNCPEADQYLSRTYRKGWEV
ncbi:MAG: S-layer homology domain-containing protein [Clostridiales bacterium]|nr:S-layer homology domain-containing protein [Clostridiales bacterium]